MNLLCILFGHQMLYAEPYSIASGGKCTRKFCKYERSPVAIPPPPWRKAHPDPPTERPRGPAPDPPPVPRSLLQKLTDFEQYEEADRYRFRMDRTPYDELAEDYADVKYASARDFYVAAVRIGEWTIRRSRDGAIWISDEAGEGGVFDEQKLAEAIEAFYMENF